MSLSSYESTAGEQVDWIVLSIRLDSLIAAAFELGRLYEQSLEAYQCGSIDKAQCQTVMRFTRKASDLLNEVGREMTAAHAAQLVEQHWQQALAELEGVV